LVDGGADGDADAGAGTGVAAGAGAADVGPGCDAGCGTAPEGDASAGCAGGAGWAGASAAAGFWGSDLEQAAAVIPTMATMVVAATIDSIMRGARRSCQGVCVLLVVGGCVDLNCQLLYVAPRPER
jgi:hypothetical protein